MNSKAMLTAFAVSPLLAGCATYNSVGAGAIDPEDFGEANRQTYAAMIVNPDPQYDEELEGSGAQAGEAAKRYREGNVKQPERVTTTSGPQN
ncbi:hypothetical protein [Erythrobacter ani]|uniref:Lipoprotein n=1 Tax=Erythrobacter ani TaxID=2827235 RepID=A0ABS6SLK0_9SPHN|nr:hypothetical protein [Erythrobacter ani]MBV7265860.1 hypothetical protein [Erythrobacter ani]